jgi:NhaP-type Na+/H+ or K+/H+ antiporter
LSTQVVTALLQFFIAHRLLHLKINYSLILRFIILVILLFATGFGLSRLQLDSWFVSMLLMFVIGVLYTIILGLFNIKELVEILKGER